MSVGVSRKKSVVGLVFGVYTGRLKMQDVKMTDQVAGHENDGPSKSQGVKVQYMKMQDVKMTDQVVKHENAGHENAGRENARHENAVVKMQ